MRRRIAPWQAWLALCALVCGLSLTDALLRWRRAHEETRSNITTPGSSTAELRASEERHDEARSTRAPGYLAVKRPEEATWDWIPPDPELPPVLFEDLAEPILPTVEGLYERTIGWWREGDFLSLTASELGRYLPEEREYVLAGSLTLSEFLVNLPTFDDCERAFQQERVRRALTETCVLEAWLFVLDSSAIERPAWIKRAPSPERIEFMRTRLRASYDAAERVLMQELERATGYPHWSFLHRAHSAWMTGGDPDGNEVPR